MKKELHIHKGDNPVRESLNSEHLCPKCRSTQIHKRNFTKTQNTLEPHTIIVGNFKTPPLPNGHVIETETKQRHSETKKGYETNGFNRYLQNILSLLTTKGCKCRWSHSISKLMVHNESIPKRKTHKPECQQTVHTLAADSTPKSSRTRGSKFNQEE